MRADTSRGGVRQIAKATDEAAYVEFMEDHKRTCKECKNIRTAASVVLPFKTTANLNPTGRESNNVDKNPK